MYGNTFQANDCTGISLFTGGGVGDLALRTCGVDVLVANELLTDRASVYSANFPESRMICGDIAKMKELIIQETRNSLQTRPLDILFATPPCQGMSKNGRGKLLNGMRSGLKPEFDERNALAFHAIDIALALQPALVVFENVPEMQYTLVQNDAGEVVDLLPELARRMGAKYEAAWRVIEFADFGVPQRRQRLITVFAKRDTFGDRPSTVHLLPEPTHSSNPGLFSKPWVTVDEALAGVPPLDARCESTAKYPSIELHKVPVLDADKYLWVSSTPPGKGAFDNQCINPHCQFSGNPVHGAGHDSNGINRASAETPIVCVKCGSRLPRPWVVENGVHRLMSGFTSAYKRMRGDLPSSALTRNLSYACSDQKLHPRENRVLSLYEACILHTLDQYDFKWKRADGKKLSDKTIREIIGESIPPKGLEVIFLHIFSLMLQSTKHPIMTHSV